jgi:hypothetical protein
MLACCPGQTRKELLGDFKGIALMQRKYNIFSIIYAHYTMGIYQRLYKELKNRGIVVKAHKPYFITARGQKIHRTDQLRYVYKNNSADHILGNRNIGFYIDKFKLDNANEIFIFHINNFLFETQLLYSKEIENPEKSRNNRLFI